MSEKNSYSRLALPSVAAAILSLIAFVIDQVSIGLTFVFFALLLIMGTFVKNRLDRIGAETWALGSVIVWFGFILVAIPLLGVAWGFMSNQSQIFIFVIGILVILLGFTTEFFDLNEKFLDWLQRTSERISKAWKEFKVRFLKSTLARIQFGLGILLILSLVLYPLTNRLAEEISDSIWLHPSLIILYFMLIILLIQTRTLLIIIIASIGAGIAWFFRGILNRLVRLPDLLSRLWHLLLEFVNWVYSWLFSSLKFIKTNSQVTGFTGFLVFTSISIGLKDPNLFAVAILLLLGALAVLLKRNPEFVNRQLTRVQQSTYRRSLWIQNRFRAPKTVECMECGTIVSKDNENCPNCLTELPTCSVCRMKISGGSMVLACTHCKQQGHEEHLNGWFKYGGRVAICPHCRQPWVNS